MQDNGVVLVASNYGTASFLYTDDSDDGKAEDAIRSKFIRKELEGMIRRSKEYKFWTSFIRASLSVDFQCYHTGAIPSMCTIEIHHYPYTLYDLCNIVMMNCSDFTTFDIAKMVMKLHYMNLVGFVPLCSTSHETFHSGLLEIPINIVEGNWRDLPKYIDVPDKLLEKIEEKKEITFENCPEEWVVKKPMYLLDNQTVTEPEPRHVDLKEWD